MLRRQRTYLCPVDVALSVIDGKWKPLILFELKKGRRRFGALHATIPSVSHKVLTQQLRQLEATGLIARISRGDGLAYELTDFGRTLRPALTALAAWGLRHHATLGVALESSRSSGRA